MDHLRPFHISVIDGPTATTPAQALPVLLLTLAVELRRTKVARTLSRLTVGVIFRLSFIDPPTV